MLDLFGTTALHTYKVNLGPYTLTIRAKNAEDAIKAAAAKWWDDEDAMPLPIDSASATMTA